MGGPATDVGEERGTAGPERPDVTLIVPTHNRPDYLETALDSVIRQDWDSWECVVVDDGSDPPARIPDGEPRLRVIRHDRPLGPAAARNTGIRAARGRYIGFLDDDDLISPRRVRDAMEALRAHPDVNCHVGALVRSETPEAVDVSQPGPVTTEERMRARTPSVGQLTLRRDIVEEFDTDLRVGEDVDWWVRVEPAVVPVISATITYVVRLHGGERRGASDDARLDARLRAYRKNAAALPKRGAAKARQQERVASAAVAAGRAGLATRFAVAALWTRPTKRRAKLLARSLLLMIGRRPPAADDLDGD